jgi:4-hydroxy-tetrahydrodipicolinate synthase
VFEFYRRVVEKTDGSGTRLYIYHFPRMTGVPVGEGVIERLLARYPERVAGIKDSGGEWEHTKRLIDRFPSLGVFPGSEVFLLDGVRAGAAGCISATVNVTAPLAAEVFARREEPAADRLQTKLTGIRREFERYPLIAGLKHVMWRRTGDSKWLNIRPPLCRLGEAAGDELVQKLEGSGA